LTGFSLLLLNQMTLFKQLKILFNKAEKHMGIEEDRYIAKPIFLENCNFAVPTDLKYNMTALLSQPPMAHICVKDKPASIAAVAPPILML